MATPFHHKKTIQRFLELANIYHRFITNFIKISSPLTTLLHNKPTSAFHQLKDAFTTVLTLVHPNPALYFVVEVDALTTGVREVLSRCCPSGRGPTQSSIHAPTFQGNCPRRSKTMTLTMLAIKLALEEWRHWLEEAKHPFEVITDHCNLE